MADLSLLKLADGLLSLPEVDSEWPKPETSPHPDAPKNASGLDLPTPPSKSADVKRIGSREPFAFWSSTVTMYLVPAQ